MCRCARKHACASVCNCSCVCVSFMRHQGRAQACCLNTRNQYGNDRSLSAHVDARLHARMHACLHAACNMHGVLSARLPVRLTAFAATSVCMQGNLGSNACQRARLHAGLPWRKYAPICTQRPVWAACARAWPSAHGAPPAPPPGCGAFCVHYPQLRVVGPNSIPYPQLLLAHAPFVPAVPYRTHSYQW